MYHSGECSEITVEVTEVAEIDHSASPNSSTELHGSNIEADLHLDEEVQEVVEEVDIQVEVVEDCLAEPASVTILESEPVPVAVETELQVHSFLYETARFFL